MKINGLILAAGESKRLGKIKQLLLHQQTPLLTHAQNQLNSLCSQVFVVLGAHHQTIQRSIKISNPIINKNWKAGIGSSLSIGAKEAQTDADGILICLSDQPLIPNAHFTSLVNTFKLNPKNIVASKYNNSFGVPAIFPPDLFEALCLSEHTDKGAKAIIYQNIGLVLSKDCNEASLDIDTKNDLSLLQ